MSITHKQARELLQFNLDGVLQAAEKARLSAHLQDCIDCKAYARELKEVEAILVPVLKRQWHMTPFPLSIDALLQRKSSRIKTSNFLSIRTSVIGAAVMALFFGFWQIVLSSTPVSGRPLAGVFPAPTPSLELTSTRIASEDCQLTLYVLQQEDTLASVSTRFSVSEEEVMRINNLNTRTLGTAVEIMIPICNSTPTGTVHPVTFTTTYTPALSLRTSTPGPAERY